MGYESWMQARPGRNSPEDNLSGRDRQLEVGVQQLLKQIPAAPNAVAEKQ